MHLRAGLRCVDCHPAGRSARDPRISAREEHQIAKGDDPGGLVRDDLDDTVVGCADCHESGRRGAPVAKHFGLPALHLERIACQACHVPERVVMPAEVQASDVFNQAPWIHSAGKRLWTFYGPDGRARNHYGFLEVMGYDDKPTEPFRPTLFRYKGKIYPGNRVHSAWPGLEIEGETALAQPRVGDIVKMWKAHLDDPKKYEALSEIADDTGDGVPEVNRPEEIDALLASVRQALADVGYPLEGTRVVWVRDDRVYRSGTEFRLVPKHEWEASPFANVHKYSHDVYPARAARDGAAVAAHRPLAFRRRPRRLAGEHAQALRPLASRRSRARLPAAPGRLRPPAQRPRTRRAFGGPLPCPRARGARDRHGELPRARAERPLVPARVGEAPSERAPGACTPGPASSSRWRSGRSRCCGRGRRGRRRGTANGSATSAAIAEAIPRRRFSAGAAGPET